MSTNPAVASLRRQWGVVALVGSSGILLFGLEEPRWLLGAVAIWAYCLWILFQGLEENYREEERALFPSFGWPTLITLARGALLAAVAGFLLLPVQAGARAFVPAVAYTLAVLLDHIDGRMARALGRTTRLGQRLDMEIDAAGILVASLLAVLYGQIPAWYVVIGMARYLFALGIAVYRLLVKPFTGTSRVAGGGAGRPSAASMACGNTDGISCRRLVARRASRARPLCRAVLRGRLSCHVRA